VIMIFVIVIPGLPAIFGNFFLPIMIGAKDVAFPKLNLFFLVPVYYRDHHGADLPVHLRRSSRHRLDVLCAIQLQDHHEYVPGGAGGLYSRVFFHPHRPELHHHHPQDAGPGDALDENAPVCLVDLRNRMDTVVCHAYRGDYAADDHSRTLSEDRFFLILPWAEIPSFTNIYSGSIPTRPFTS